MITWIGPSVLWGCAAHTPVTTMVQQGLLDVNGAEGEWAPAPSRALVPLGRWVRVGATTAFTYVDEEAGLTARWVTDDGITHLRRLSWAPPGMVVVVDDTGLPATPAWLADYGPQPPPGTYFGRWRRDAAFAGRFHSDEFPDDLRVGVGSPAQWEVVWLSLRSCEGSRCQGALLNQPDHVPLVLGQQLWFDLAQAAPGRLPAGTPLGVEPDPAFLAFLATSPAVEGLLQDLGAWIVDYDAPPAERLVPVGSYGWVGEDVVWFFAHETGPGAAILTGRRGYQSLTWLPKGYRPLSEAERVKFDLPERLNLDGVPRQPPPGLWGTWRVDPATAWLFTNGNDPDLVRVTFAEGGVGALRVDGCDAMKCTGVLAGDGGGFRSGDRLELVHLIPDDVDPTGMVPVAMSPKATPVP